MPNIDLSILNQRQTPAFYADVFANRPAAGFVGRIFVSTDTFAFYRDNGTGWDLIGGPGTGTVTGTGAAGQVSYWSGASTITGDNGLFYDAVNDRLGIGTITPGAAIDAHSSANIIQQLNQTVATNNSLLAFQNSGAGLWRIGNFYNGGANDLGIFDVIGNIQPLTVKKTSGQVLIGTSTVGAGKLVVASASSDNGVQIVGASAPSLRIDNAETGATKRAGLGISTAINNFIQGSADRDFCMFNGSTTASPILFGIYGTTNVQEAARISAARNFLVGTTTDAGQKLQVNGNSYINGTLGIGVLSPTATLHVTDLSGGNVFKFNSGSTVLEYFVSGGNPTFGTASNNDLRIMTNNVTRLTLASTGEATFAGNVSIGTTLNAVILQTSANGGAGQVQFDQYGTVGSNILLRSARGTSAAPTATTAGDLLGSIGSRGYDGTNFSGGGRVGMYMYAAENFTATNQGSFLIFGTTPIGTASRVERVRLNDNGNLLLNTTTDAGQKLQVNGSSYFNNTIIANETIGKNGESGTVATGTTKTINANGYGGNLSAGFIVCSAALSSGSNNAVLILAQIHTNGANAYTSILSQNDTAQLTVSLVGTQIDIVNTTGSTITYNCRFINFCNLTTWSNGI